MSLSAGARQAFRVYVGNLPWTIGNPELRHWASSFGPVVFSQVIFNKETGLSKGFGFVAFGTRDSYNAMIKSSTGHYLEGQHLSVNPANSNPTNSGGAMPPGSGDE